jgi:glutamate-ammonia-ligase adenylyltransferase
MGVSQFLWEDFLRMQHENLYPVVVNSPDLDRHKSIEQLTDECCPSTTQLPQRMKE